MLTFPTLVMCMNIVSKTKRPKTLTIIIIIIIIINNNHHNNHNINNVEIVVGYLHGILILKSEKDFKLQVVLHFNMAEKVKNAT